MEECNPDFEILSFDLTAVSNLILSTQVSHIIETQSYRYEYGGDLNIRNCLVCMDDLIHFLANSEFESKNDLRNRTQELNLDLESYLMHVIFALNENEIIYVEKRVNYIKGIGFKTRFYTTLKDHHSIKFRLNFCLKQFNYLSN